MGSSSKRGRFCTLVANGKILFLQLGQENTHKSLASLDLEEFLRRDDLADIVGKIGSRKNELLIIPDFWLGMQSYLINPGKTSLVETYVKRKLRSDYQGIIGVENYFDFVPYDFGGGKMGVHTYFAQDPTFFEVCEKLGKLRLAPDNITTPGLVWENKLKKLHENFQQESFFLVCLVGSECFFYFFHRGQYLFSRDISISRNVQLSERLDVLSFEIDQSRFLFSQKTKADIDQICLVAPPAETIKADELSKRLGRKVTQLDLGKGEREQEQSEDLGSISNFSASELTSAGEFANLAHRELRKERDWKPVQLSALVLGGIFCLLMAAQAAYLHLGSAGQALDEGGLGAGRKLQVVRQMNQTMDKVLAEEKRLSFVAVMNQIRSAVPATVRVDKVTIETRPRSVATIKGTVTARGPAQFKEVISQLARGVRDAFPANGDLKAEDIEFRREDAQEGAKGSTYLVEVVIKLS